MRLTGARTLITGASSGIGAVTATRMAALGAVPLLVGRSEQALTELAASTGGKQLVADLGRPGAARTIADWAGDVDVLVCNAGIGFAGDLAEQDLAAIDELVTVNLTAHLGLARLLLPGMLARRSGHLVLVSSIAGCLGVADEAVYAATKAALRTFADSVRLATAGTGVGVSVVVPGVVDTPFFVRRGKPYDRSRPKPVPAGDVAEALVDAVLRNRAEVFVPAWLRFPARLHGAIPGLVYQLQRRFG
ncbi:MAG TPA: SDR family NAD(P)-dependent oxidoreductase [Pseudonocardiaceae bacterium]|nr:SDR family NAD(P)-dependent oxidoreductase [Pseudonocardiaceae bacterium]